MESFTPRTQKTVRRTFTININKLLQTTSWVAASFSVPFVRLCTNHARIALLYPLLTIILPLLVLYGVDLKIALVICGLFMIVIVLITELNGPTLVIIKSVKFLVMSFVIADPVGFVLTIVMGYATLASGEYRIGAIGTVLVPMGSRVFFNVNFRRNRVTPCRLTRWYIAVRFQGNVADLYYQSDFSSGVVNTQFNKAESTPPLFGRSLGTHPFLSLPDIGAWPVVIYRCSKPRQVKDWETFDEILPWMTQNSGSLGPVSLVLENAFPGRRSAILVAVFAETDAPELKQVVTNTQRGTASPTANELAKLFDALNEKRAQEVSPDEQEQTSDDEPTRETESLFEEPSTESKGWVIPQLEAEEPSSDLDRIVQKHFERYFPNGESREGDPR